MMVMNLKNRFRLVIFSMCVLLVSIAIIVFVGIRHTNAHIQESISADEIVIDLYALRILNSEYVSAPSERVKQQWRAKYDKIKNKLVLLSVNIPDDVENAFKDLLPVFERMAAMPNTPQGVEPVQKRLKNQISASLDLESQRIIDWASEISNQMKGGIVPRQIFMGTMMLSVILVIALTTITIMLFTTGRILLSIKTLKDGAEKIASGNLGFQVKQIGNDEISLLSTDINKMSRDLEVSYNSLHDQTLQLENEMAERQKLYEALQKKTTELNDEIEERKVVQQELEEQTAELEEEVAERIRAQDEHNQLAEQLRQAQKMEAIGLLAGGVAHDFNNILTVIMGYGSMLIGCLPTGTEHDNAAQIMKASERAAELTRALLAFSSKQAFNLERTDINQLGAENGKFLKRVIGEDIELVTSYHPKPLYVSIDRSQIQQVLMNLATNARDAMPTGGKLTISITPEKPDKSLVARHGHGNPGDHALIRVSDTGTGMDRETVERIFEPFFTTKEKGKGTGLGLSIIHGIITQHNGIIHCGSEPGRGTTFSIYLPLCSTSGSGVEPAAAVECRPPCGTETILLAEDDDMLMDLTASILESSGYKVLQAHDGLEAVDIFTKRRDEIDLVMLDAIMPGMTGKQAWNEISSIRPDVKACFISGYTQEIISGKLAIDFNLPLISKPVMPGTILRIVREILDRGEIQKSEGLP